MSYLDNDHDGLARAYGRSVDSAKWQVFYGVRLGMFVEGCAEADVMLIRKSYARSEIRIIETKVSTSDLKRDVTEGKYRKYLPYCDRFFWLCGKGVDTSILDSITDTGLILPAGQGFRTKRVGKWNERKPLSEEVLLALIMSHFESDSRLARMEYRLAELLKPDLRHAYLNFSREISRRERKLEERELKVGGLERQTKKQVLAELREQLGLCQRFWEPGSQQLLADLLTDGLVHHFGENLARVQNLLGAAE